MSAVVAPSPFDLLTRELPLGQQRAMQGSDEITVWCPCCLEKTIPLRNGQCAFCDTPLTEEAIERERASQSVGIDQEAVRRTVARANRIDVARTAEPKVRVPRRRKRSGNRHRPAFTDEQILARIQLWERLTGRPPAKADWNPAKLKRRSATARGHIDRHLRLLALYEMGDFPSETTVRARFGSMNSALVRAGFQPRATGRQPTTAHGVGKPKIGRDALRAYWQTVQGNLDGDEVALKASLYELAMSAFWLADRLHGEESA